MAERSGVSHGGRVRLPRKCRISSYDTVHDELRTKLRKVADILKKTELDLTAEEHDILRHNPDMVQRAKKRAELRASKKKRDLETEDPPDVFQTKCEALANAIKKSKNVVVYTGAGISTAASIPDYRGPNGVWTLLRQGKELRALDLSDAEPTLTHMGITKLYRLGHVKHVVSQNCDGLHLRSGLPRRALSELHGNMYIEKCRSCRPHKEYIRLFDVTERTRVRRHGTGRFCHKCGGELRDTIIHFGERGELNAPYRWKEAARAADNADIILCLGSSLKVLRKYTGLWCMNKRPQNRPSLYVVNLQWTPKDDVATLKINGRCDDVIRMVMRHMGVPIPSYARESDPIFRFATALNKDEYETTSKKILVVPEMVRTRRDSYKKMRMKEEVEPEDTEEDSKPDLDLAKVRVEKDSLPEEAVGSKFIFTSSSLAALPSSTLSVAPVAMGAVPAEVALVSANVEIAATDVGMAATDVGVSLANVGVSPAGVGVAPAEMNIASSGICVAPEGIVPIWSNSGSILMTSTGLLYTAPLLPVVSSACLAVQQLSSSGLAHVFVSAKEVSPSQHLSVTPQVSVPSPHVSVPSSQASGLKVEGSDASAPPALQDHCYCRHQKGNGSRADSSTGATVFLHTATSTLCHPAANATTALPHPAAISGCTNPTQDASDSSITSSTSQGLGTTQMPSSSNNSGEMQSCRSAAAPQRSDTEATDVKKDIDSGEDEPKASNEAAKGNKRKVTVPGWFGKGLTLKKRKKYF